MPIAYASSEALHVHGWTKLENLEEMAPQMSVELVVRLNPRLPIQLTNLVELYTALLTRHLPGAGKERVLYQL